MKKLILTFCFLFICSSALAVNYCSDANCKGCWGMENATTETDLSSGGTNLTVSAGDTIPQSSDHKFGTYSRDFELDDADYLTAADGGATDINGANQTFSVCGWYKMETVPAVGSYGPIVGKWLIGTNQRQYMLASYITGGITYGRFRLSNDGTAANNATGATALTAGVWYHLCGVYNDTDMRFYLNGSLDSNGASNPLVYSSGIFNGSSAFYVGTNSSALDYLSDGLIDDVCIFNRELSSTEVSNIYTNGCQGTRRIISVE